MDSTNREQPVKFWFCLQCHYAMDANLPVKACPKCGCREFTAIPPKKDERRAFPMDDRRQEPQ